MATISKRTQARNERVLQDLIKTVPGNDRCADCGARNPGWASWSIGIFLCMRCASLHRKLGTHISKVKSLSMDSWSNDQVDNMKRNGNASINRTYNPRNAKPPIPLDVDEVDLVLERFIRQKYDQQSYTSGAVRPAVRNDTGSTRSSDDQPPPLPPKPAKRFGFGLRSVSSVLPLHRSGPTSPPRSPPAGNGWQDEPLRVNKQSRVFGASVGGNNDNIEAKLAQLRDMGFTDEKRNTSVLKGLSGNVEKTIESLIRLGEGTAPMPKARAAVTPRNVAVSQPMPSTNQSANEPNGISFMPGSAGPRVNPGSTAQSDSQASVVPQQQSEIRSFSPANPYQPQAQPPTQSYNPFDPSHDQRSRLASMDQSFSNMQVSQQPLFPNATGGYPNQANHVQDTRTQTMTPPVPLMPHHISQNNPYMQQNQSINGNHNPFYQPTQQSVPTSPNPYASNVQQQNTAQTYNPFIQSSAMSPPQHSYSTDSPQTYSPHLQQTFQPQLPPQQQYQNQTKPQIPLFAPQHSFTDPLQYGSQSQLPPQQNSNPYQQQPLVPQQTGRIDKSSILALYNLPQPAPPPLPHDENRQLNTTMTQAPQAPPQQHGPPQRSVTMPAPPSTGSRNPFQSSTNGQPKANGNPPPGVGRHVSQESVDIGGFQNGRHSPDAFASLSARFPR